MYRVAHLAREALGSTGESMRQGLRQGVCAAVSVVSIAGGLVAMSMAGDAVGYSEW